MIISDPSPIIVLGKLGYLEMLKRCFSKIIISKKIYDEILIKHNTPEVFALKKAIEEKWIIVEDVEVDELLSTININGGEKEAISLAHKFRCPLLTDDAPAKSYALLFNIEVHGTIYVILLSYKNKLITKKKSKLLLDSIIGGGFYISNALYMRFLEMLESIK